MSDRNGKIFCTSIASLSHISKAAGLGTRLAPITDEHPKCMTEVIDGKTIIQKQIENLLENNI